MNQPIKSGIKLGSYSNSDSLNLKTNGNGEHTISLIFPNLPFKPLSPPAKSNGGDIMQLPPIYRLPSDSLHQIFSSLPLRQIMICRCVCKFFNQAISSQCFTEVMSTQRPLNLLALRIPAASIPPYIHVYDPERNRWFIFNLDFLPFRFLQPVASSSGLIYLWGDSFDSTESNQSLIACNPITRQFKVLPYLGSAWSRYGTVLVDSVNRVMVLTEIGALYYSGKVNTNQWLKFSSNLPSKPKSPVLISTTVFALCNVKSSWRIQWKLFSCILTNLKITSMNWICLEKLEWGDIIDIMKRPYLLQGNSESKLLMIGRLKSSFSLNPPCSSILILQLDLESMVWEEASRMPLDMYRGFKDSNKFKVFGGGDRVYLSSKRVRKLVMWDFREGWRWIDGVPGYSDGLCKGFVLDAKLTMMP